MSQFVVVAGAKYTEASYIEQIFMKNVLLNFVSLYNGCD